MKTPGRGLAGRSLAVVYILAICVPLLLAAASGIEPADIWAEAAAASGMAAVAIFLVQFASSGRFRPFSGRIGIDMTMAFHKWAAPFGLLLVVAHVVLVAGPLDIADPGRTLRRLWAYLASPLLWAGTAAVAVFVVLIASALIRDRIGIGYHNWRISHLVLAGAAVGLCVYHALDSGTYSNELPLRVFWLATGLAAIAAPVAMHVRRRFAVSPWRVSRCQRAGDRLWALELSADGDSLPFRAGQFVWLRIGSRPPWMDNPFSIASPPGAPGLAFLIREAGDATRTVPHLQPGTPVAVEGPHGSFTLDGLEFDSLLLIAGGVGVAPILSILHDLARNGEGRPVRLIYAAGHRTGMVDLSRFGAVDQLGAQRLFLADDAADSDPNVMRGPLTEAHLANAISGLDPQKAVAMICGPPPMTTFAADTLHKLGVPLRNIRYERFSYNAVRPSAKDVGTLFRFAAVGAAVMVAAAVFAGRALFTG